MLFHLKQGPSGHPTSASNVVWIIINYSSTRVSWGLLAFCVWERADSLLPILRKQCYCWGRTMKFCRLLYLPKNYPFSKFGCHSLIHDIIMASLLYLVLLPDKNVASAFILFSVMLEWCQLYFHQKIANCVIRLSNSGFKREVKLIKFRISWAILMSRPLCSFA